MRSGVLKNTRLAASFIGGTIALSLSGCVTSGPPQSNVRPVAYPQRSTAVVAVPPAHGVVTARPVVVEEVVPESSDLYIRAAANADIVFVGGSTYIWAVGPDGHRHRHFYARGDRRQEVFHRRDNLRSVVSHRNGHTSAVYASHDGGRPHEDLHRGRLAHGPEVHDHGRVPQHTLAANAPRPRVDSHDEQKAKRSRSLREASVERHGGRVGAVPGV